VLVVPVPAALMVAVGEGRRGRDGGSAGEGGESKVLQFHDRLLFSGPTRKQRAW
jgi:hypothetical protein